MFGFLLLCYLWGQQTHELRRRSEPPVRGVVESWVVHPEGTSATDPKGGISPTLLSGCTTDGVRDSVRYKIGGPVRVTGNVQEVGVVGNNPTTP